MLNVHKITRSWVWLVVVENGYVGAVDSGQVGHLQLNMISVVFQVMRLTQEGHLKKERKVLFPVVVALI